MAHLLSGKELPEFARDALEVLRQPLEEGVVSVSRIVYEAQADTAYWLYVQADFQNRPDSELTLAGETVTVYLDKANVVTTETIRQFARYKTDVIRQRPEVIRYVF